MDPPDGFDPPAEDPGPKPRPRQGGGGEALGRAFLDGFSDEEIADAVQRNHAILARMEAVLNEGPWLVGRTYGLADIARFPNVLLLDLLGFPT